MLTDGLLPHCSPAALLAMLVEVNTATALVSFGTMVALWLVVNAQLYRRYFPDVQLRFTRQVAQKDDTERCSFCAPAVSSL